MRLTILFFLAINLATCQNPELLEEVAAVIIEVGGPCDGCELMYQGIPGEMDQKDTSAGWLESSSKLLVTGKVLTNDGKPVGGIILYYWQTDDNGYYSPGDQSSKSARAHGHIRGWLKTNAAGEYEIYTSIPAPYPGRNTPAHIHILVKEPGLSEYYIDDILFDNDPLLTKKWRNGVENRGGSGIVRLVQRNDILVAEKNIILGLNIPNHPQDIVAAKTGDSGLSIGEDQPSFTPFHAWGPDKGSIACPVCKYGRFHGVLYFAGEKESWENIQQWLLFLENQTKMRGSHLKVYFIYGNAKQYSFDSRERKLEKLGKELSLKNVALTFVPSFQDKKSEILKSQINAQVRNTFIVYRHRNIVGKFINLDPVETDFLKIQTILDETSSPYFEWESVH